MNVPFGTNGKFIILGVPILKHIRVLSCTKESALGNSSCFYYHFNSVYLKLLIPQKKKDKVNFQGPKKIHFEMLVVWDAL